MIAERGVEPSIYWPAEDVAQVCGLPLTILHSTYRPRNWVRGLQWAEMGGRVFYRDGNICEFCGVLATSEKLDAAQRLMTWLVARGERTTEFTAGSSGTADNSIAGSVAETTAAPARATLGWMQRWEFAHES